MKKVAILIGSSNYKDNSLHDLRCPELDVKGLVQVFEDESIGQFNEVKTYINQNSHDVIVGIQSQLNELVNGDTLVIYFSGHGKINLMGNLYLTTTNTNVNLLEATAIELALLYRLIKGSICNKVIVILDCCYSGAVGEAITKGSVEDQLKMASQGSGTVLLTASTGMQVALEKKEDEYSLFTKHLIHGLKTGEPDLNGDGFITINELYNYAYKKVTSESAQEPTCSGIDLKGDLTIAKSDKQPRIDREKKLEKLLVSLRNDLRIDKVLFREAYDIIGHTAEELSDEQTKKDELLTKLSKGEIESVDLVVKWNNLSVQTTVLKAPIRHNSNGNPTVQSIKEKTVFSWWKQTLFLLIILVFCTTWHISDSISLSFSWLLLVITYYVSVKYQARVAHLLLLSSPAFLVRFDFDNLNWGEPTATLFLLIAINFCLVNDKSLPIRHGVELLKRHRLVTFCLIPCSFLVLSGRFYFTDVFYVLLYISYRFLLPLLVVTYCIVNREKTNVLYLLTGYISVVFVSLMLKYLEVAIYIDLESGSIFLGLTRINWFEPLLVAALAWCALSFKQDLEEKKLGLFNKYAFCAIASFILYLLNQAGLNLETLISDLLSEPLSKSAPVDPNLERIEVTGYNTGLFYNEFSGYWLLLFYGFWGAATAKVKWYVPILLGVVLYFMITMSVVVSQNYALIDFILLLSIVLIFQFSAKYKHVIQKKL